MATKSTKVKKSKTAVKPAEKAETTSVTRIKAKDSSATKKTSKPNDKTAAAIKEYKTTVAKETRSARKNPLRAIGGYFAGAWAELRQVRWPNRRATWSMTGALVLFTVMFAVFIGLLDAGFKYLFQLMLG